MNYRQSKVRKIFDTTPGYALLTTLTIKCLTTGQQQQNICHGHFDTYIMKRTNTRIGFSYLSERVEKANKILAILEADNRPFKDGHLALDIGTGSGEIAEIISRIGEVIAVDLVDQRVKGKDLPFACCDEHLPFTDNSFDLVISNHVIEHVKNPELHLQEIYRVLRPSGTLYLATPNRWWPWEVYCKIPLLHYLRWDWFSKLALLLGKTNETIQLQSLLSIKGLANDQYHIQVWHPEVVADPERYKLTLPKYVAPIIRYIPKKFLHITAPFHPTLITLMFPLK